VRDTGIGIKPEELPQLFDPFFTTKPMGPARTVGELRIINRHGGQIEAESKPGKFTDLACAADYHEA